MLPAFALSALSARAADSVVVFNEIHYHPVTNEPALEWVELHNQMALDVDLSAWSLAGGIDYTFPEGTFIAGGGYLVVALDPAVLQAATGLTNVVGPFTGRLSNNGERIELRDRNRRLMDAVSYGVDGDWPVAPDGAGPTLAKRDEDSPSDDASYWTASPLIGGTPGRRNESAPPATNATAMQIFVPMEQSWRYDQSGADLGTAWRAPAYDDRAWPAGPALLYVSTNALQAPKNTPLTLGPTTYYFRTEFVFSGGTPRSLTLRHIVDDGAVFYLNGAELTRYRMPAGEIRYTNTASAGVGIPTLQTISNLPATSLVVGTNVLAVEVHQAVNPGGDVVFGAEVSIEFESVAPASPLAGVAFNEMSSVTNAQFWIEIVNHGTENAALDGCVLARFGTTNCEYVIPAQTVPPGGYCVLDHVTLGFGADPGDRVILYAPGKTRVLDAVVAKSFPRARWPEGTGPWLHPSEPTPGASNRFAFHDEIVINEIMYHHPPRLEMPSEVSAGTTQTNPLVTITNVWRYDQSGADLGTAWRAPAYDDRAWPTGRALLYVSTATLPAPKNTPLTLGPTTYYFRTTFLHTGGPPAALLLRHIVDDGAVFYLNGVEVNRYRMPAGEIVYTNTASAGIGIPTWSAFTNLDPGPLLTGTNVLAVEVHQALSTGNDIVFGAELSVVGAVAPAVPYQESEEEWIELFNRGSNAVDLAGWRLDEGIDFRFASNTVIPPGGYLVVARDPAAMLTNYPGLTVVGPYTNRLSRRRERVVLKDASDNPACAVRYYDGGRWPEAADGGGSSLELRNPFADVSAAEAWAASDEGRKSAWRTYTYRGVAAPSFNAPTVGVPDGSGLDEQWREFVIGLLDAGEILLDDIRVIESPDSSPVQLIQNGTFDTGTNKWRIIGNHHGEVIDDPDQPGNKVLRLVATGTTEHMSNHGETTLANNAAVVNGRTYEISFRAKWIRGSRQLNARLYFNRLAKTTVLDAPALLGTPGARNSTYTTHLGPTYAAFRHEPPVPAPLAPVTVSVQAHDRDGVAAMTLWWRTDGGAWTSAPMSATGSRLTPHASRLTYREFAATIPGQPAGTIVQFYVEGRDALGVASTFPAAGPDSRALFKVDDGQAATNGLHNFRIIMLTEDANWLHNPLNALSNERLGCTVICDEREAFYDAGVRLKGSEVSRASSGNMGFFVAFPSDHLLRGTHHTVSIERAGGAGTGQREMLVHQMFQHAGGLPAKYHDLIQLIAPRPEHSRPAELQLARYTDVFLDDQFPNGSDGMLFEYEIIYRLTTTDTGTPEGNKVPQSDGWVGSYIQDLGDNKEHYRWTFLVDNNRARDDYSRLLPWAKTMGQSGAAFNAVTNLIDVDQWLRAFAASVLSGTSDNYGAVGDVHNGYFYVRPSDQRVLFFPQDLDLLVEPTRPIVHNHLSRLIAVPAHARAYYRHLRDIIATTCNTAYMSYWTAHFARLLPDQPFASYLQFFDDRANFVLSQINQAAPPVAFAITSNNGRDFASTTNHVALEGNGWLDLAGLEVNGVPYAINWVGVTRWAITVPLAAGANLLTLQGVDDAGNRPTNFTAQITVTNTGPPALRPVVINEWMADNAAPGGFPDPADGLFQDWFELFNPNAVAVNLSGYHLTDDLSRPTKWTIPSNTVVAAGGFLLVWADEDGAQNGTGTNGDLHANFKLSAGGEALGLFAPDGVTPQHTVVFGPQFQNVSQGLFPDGDTNAASFMTNWTPRAANRLGGLGEVRLGTVGISGAGVTLRWNAVEGRAYQVQFTDDLAAAFWTNLGPPLRATGPTVFIVDPLIPPSPQRFYRVVLLR